MLFAIGMLGDLPCPTAAVSFVGMFSLHQNGRLVGVCLQDWTGTGEWGVLMVMPNQMSEGSFARLRGVEARWDVNTTGWMIVLLEIEC